ncbi:MAG: hypothetical protein GX109_08980 [Bacteroidales bacterium]|jgi:uncharacterized radical SAM superfamily Fe-S cluster-containing enzyme|nr:hypothetical protein [Bacteroidales bacterium]
MKVLEDLYYGNINPYEKFFNRKSEYAKLAKIITENEEKITAFLNALPNSEEEQHLFSQMINAHSEITQFSEFVRFMEGFRLGASIMLETFVLPQQSVIRDIY